MTFKFRMRHGLRWRKHFPLWSDLDGPLLRWTLYEIVAFIFIGMTWCWSMDRDFAEQKQQEAKEVWSWYLRCLNGRDVMIHEDGSTFTRCERAWSSDGK